MDEARPGSGELVAGAGGVLLLLAMLLPWYGLDASVVVPGTDRRVTVSGAGLDAWESFGLVDLLLAGTAALAITMLVAAAASSLATPGLALATGSLAALSALAIVYRLIDPPSLAVPAESDASFEVARRIGSFFGLLCTAAIGWGAGRVAARPRVGAAPRPRPDRRRTRSGVAPAPPRLWSAATSTPRLAAWTRADIETECARAWRSYDRRLTTRYARYFEQHPELAGKQRSSARDLESALPPGWGELAAAVPPDGWQRHHLSGKSSQTLTVGLLGVAAARDPSLAWLFEALELEARPAEPRLGFEHSVEPGLLGERPRQTSLDLLVEDDSALLCVETSWRESGLAGCTCRGTGVGPVEGRCARAVEGRTAYWEAASELLGLPRREAGGPCPISPPHQAVRAAAAARALAGPDRPALLALVYDANNPYFAGLGDWPGWPAMLRAAVEASADPAAFRFSAISWQELVPRLPLDDATRAWAREKHGLES